MTATVASDTTVVCLFFGGRPAHVSGFVMAVVVDAIQRMIRGWSWAHIGQKGGEVLRPLATDADPPCAVALPRRVPRIATSLFHATPSPVFRSQHPTTRGPMTAEPASVAVLNKAAARGRHPAAETGRRHNDRPAAIALAVPGDNATRLRPYEAIGRTGRDNQSAKPLPTQFQTTHRFNYTTVTAQFNDGGAP